MANTKCHKSISKKGFLLFLSVLREKINTRTFLSNHTLQRNKNNIVRCFQWQGCERIQLKVYLQQRKQQKGETQYEPPHQLFREIPEIHNQTGQQVEERGVKQEAAKPYFHLPLIFCTVFFKAVYFLWRKNITIN